MGYLVRSAFDQRFIGTVLNGDFSSGGTDWNEFLAASGATIDYTSSRLNYAGDGSGNSSIVARNDTILQLNTNQQIQYEILSVTGTLQIRLVIGEVDAGGFGTIDFSGTLRSSPGVYTEHFTPVTATSRIFFQIADTLFAPGATALQLDNVMFIG